MSGGPVAAPLTLLLVGVVARGGGGGDGVREWVERQSEEEEEEEEFVVVVMEWVEEEEYEWRNGFKRKVRRSRGVTMGRGKRKKTHSRRSDRSSNRRITKTVY